ncbi:hypothetical protein BH23PLA1_BH23PLA1_15080 [soil metagenome]
MSGSVGKQAPADRDSSRDRWAWLRVPEANLAVAIVAVVGLIYVLDPGPWHTLDPSLSRPFFSQYSLQNLSHNAALYGILALGAAVVIIAGGIDLSIGSVVALSAVVSARLMTSWLPEIRETGSWGTLGLIGATVLFSTSSGIMARRIHPRALPLPGWVPGVALAVTLIPWFFGVGPGGVLAMVALLLAITALGLLVGLSLGLRRGAVALAIASGVVTLWGILTEPGKADNLPIGIVVAGCGLTMLMGLTIGVTHAAMINYFQLPAFIATLATLAGFRSLARILSREQTITVFSENFRVFGKDFQYTIPIFLAVAAIVSIVMGRMVLGRHLYALGGNEAAARLSGLPTRRLKTIAYALSGLLAALGGLLFFGNTGQADSRMGVTYELFAITAAVVGGCSLAGGVGSIRGTVLGLILIRIVITGTGLVVKNISPSQIEGLVLGVVVVLAVAFNQRFRLRS